MSFKRITALTVLTFMFLIPEPLALVFKMVRIINYHNMAEAAGKRLTPQEQLYWERERNARRERELKQKLDRERNARRELERQDQLRWEYERHARQERQEHSPSPPCREHRSR